VRKLDRTGATSALNEPLTSIKGTSRGGCIPTIREMKPIAVPQQLIDAFAADGVVCVRNVLDVEELAAARSAIERVMAAPGPLAQVASSPEDPGRFFEDFCRWNEISEIEQLARHSAVPDVAGRLMATAEVRFFHDHVLVKEGRTRQRTPWHQDQPYYNVDGRGVSAWIPVDPVPQSGALEVVAGTHHGPWLMPRTFLSGEARWFPEGSLKELPDIEADRAGFDIRSFEMQPGDGLFFDFLSVHGAPGFPFDGRRRVLSLRYLSDQARHAPRRWRTSPPFDGLEQELAPGAPMDHRLFPVVWSR
jgi:ectoine hydroxylase-related dioxygenase (phytanoyl-CoA dioxygenase family)